MGCGCKDELDDCPCKEENERLKQALTYQQGAYEQKISALEQRINDLHGAVYVLTKEMVLS